MCVYISTCAEHFGAVGGQALISGQGQRFQLIKNSALFHSQIIADEAEWQFRNTSKFSIPNQQHKVGPA